MLRSTPAVAAVLALMLAPAVAASSYTPLVPVWVPVEPADRAVSFDVDGDGRYEAVAPGGLVLESYEWLRYLDAPPGAVLVADPDSDLVPELVVVAGDGSLYWLEEGGVAGPLQVPAGAEAIVADYAVAFGPAVVWQGRVYRVPGVQAAPAATPSKLYIAWTDGERLLLYRADTGASEVVVPEPLTPVYAGLARDGNVSIAARTPDGRLAVIRYEPGSKTPFIAVYNVEPEKGIYYSPAEDYFIVAANGMLYKASINGLALVSEWRLISFDYYFVYLYDGEGSIAVYTRRGSLLAVAAAPEPGEEPVYAAGYPVVLVSYGDRAYAGVAERPPRVHVSLPYRVYAGEPFHVRVLADAVYSILVDGVPSNGTVVIDEPGEHTIIVSVAWLEASFNVTRTVVVEPRPLRIHIMAPSVFKPFSYFNITVYAYDALDWEPADASCLVSLLGFEAEAAPGEPVRVWVGLPDGGLAVLNVTCSGLRYGAVSVVRLVEVSPVKPRIQLDAVGGVLVVDAVLPDGSTAPGLIVVKRGNETIAYGEPPLEFEVEPGNYTLTVEYTPTHPVVAPAKATVSFDVGGEAYTPPTDYTVIVTIPGQAECRQPPAGGEEQAPSPAPATPGGEERGRGSILGAALAILAVVILAAAGFSLFRSKTVREYDITPRGGEG